MHGALHAENVMSIDITAVRLPQFTLSVSYYVLSSTQSFGEATTDNSCFVGCQKAQRQSEVACSQHRPPRLHTHRPDNQSTIPVMAYVCSQHGREATSGCNECFLLEEIKKLKEESLEEKNVLQEKLKESQEEKNVSQEKLKESQEENNVLKGENKKIKKQFPTFQEIASKTIHIPNETASSAHTATGHHTAIHKAMEIPKVTLNTDFLGSRPKFEFPHHINGEPGVNATLMNLLNAIIKALGLQSYIHSMLDVP
eukprot:scaffold2316_cov55-Cylindrotheca_fusiformis.AAC.1